LSLRPLALRFSASSPAKKAAVFLIPLVTGAFYFYLLFNLLAGNRK
jgi:hypothetical protein